LYAQEAQETDSQEIVFRLPDLDHATSSVLNSLSSPRSRRNYKFAMEQFIVWYCSESRLALNRTVLLRSAYTWSHSASQPEPLARDLPRSGAWPMRQRIRAY
jgi:hypothetical protein